mgnify:CR=1 FL=1
MFDLAQWCVGGAGQLQAIHEVDGALERNVRQVPQHQGSQPGTDRRYSTSITKLHSTHPTIFPAFGN